MKGEKLMISIGNGACLFGNRDYLLLSCFILMKVFFAKAQEVIAAAFNTTKSQEIKEKIITANSSDKPVIVNVNLEKNYKPIYLRRRG